MISKNSAWWRLVGGLLAALTLMLAAPVTASAAQYLPLTLQDVAPADKAVVANPAPVQLLFQFKTKGAPNPQATQYLTKPVTDHVKAFGAFSEVTSGPAAGGAVLSITLENIPEDGALEKGFATGLTFGLAGSTVIDFYICTFEYIPAPGAAKVTKEVRHSIITTVGLTKAPPNTFKTKGFEDAVKIMTRQVITHGINDLAKDPGFTVAAAPAAEPAAPAEPPAPPAEPAPDALPAAPPAAAPGGRR